MRLLLTKLFNGDEKLLNQIKKGEEIWREILKKFDLNNIPSIEENRERYYELVDKIASELTIAQIPQFETKIGDRWLGQEIMCFVAFAQFYDEYSGIDLEKTLILRDAFDRSWCSLEVKYVAEQYAELYGVNRDE